jgi:O-antigen/teichoic acid export membrane protein
MKTAPRIHILKSIRQKIAQCRNLPKAAENAGWMMADQVTRQAVGLIVGVWLARYLGPQLFGQLSYAFALVLIASPIAMLALDGIAIRRMAQDPDCQNRIVGTSFFLMLVSGIISYVVTMVAVLFFKPGDSLITGLVAILAAGMIAQSFIAIEFWFESQMQWKYTVYAKTSAFLLANCCKIALILLKAPLMAFAWIGLAETVIGAIGLLLVYRFRGLSIKAWRFSRSVAVSLLRDSWPLFFSTILTMIYLRIDQVMIGNMLSSEELGIYSVAVRISEAWFFIPMVLSSALFPALVKIETRSEVDFNAQMQKLYNWMVFLAYVVALPVTIFSADIIRLLFSSSYIGAAPVLAVLIWTGVFTSLGVAREVFILSKNLTRVNLVAVTLGAGLNVVLNYLLIPVYGIHGAVVATFISYWLAVHGTCLLLKPLRKTGWMMTRAIFYPRVW